MTQQEIRSLIEGLIIDNTTQQVSPAKLRSVLNAINDAIPSAVSIGVNEPLQLDPFTSKISIPKASTAQDGYLDKVDFADFKEKFFEIIAGTLRNKDNSLNMLFRFLSQKGLTIDTPSGSPDWKVLRLLNNAIEQFSLTQNGRMSVNRLSGSEYIEGAAVRFGAGILNFLTQIQYANSAAANVKNAQLDSTGYDAAGGGGMLEYKFLSEDVATLDRELRLLCNKDVRPFELHTFVGVSPINQTSETLIRMLTVPANYNRAESILYLLSRFNFSGTASIKNLRIRHSTTNSFSTSHTLVATLNVASGSLYTAFERHGRISNGNITFINAGISAVTDVITSTNAVTTFAYNPAVTNYFWISGFVANAADSITPGFSLGERKI